jgi:MOSC domain-containing protein YiiM
MKKKAVACGTFKEEFGMLTDAHASSEWHRQVSLLAMESIEKMRKLGVNVGPGDFAENLTTEGIELVTLPVGTKLTVGNSVLLEISQIGKECHTRCAIFQQVGTCVMPTEGVFARVIKGGEIKAGDTIKIV